MVVWLVILVWVLFLMTLGAFIAGRQRDRRWAVSLRDANFTGDASVSQQGHPREMRWSRRERPGLTVFTDRCLKEAVGRPGPNVAWLLEPRQIDPEIYEWIPKHWESFDAVLSHDRVLAREHPEQVTYVPNAMTWIPPNRRGLAPKTADISFIASAKRGLPAYELRHEVYRRVIGRVDCFGTITGRFLKDRAAAFRPYRYAIVIENGQQPGYFSEKLIDALLTGTVPLYRGDPEIELVFNKRGILTWQTLPELEDLLQNVTPQRYRYLRTYVQDNYQRARRYCQAEDFVAPALRRILGAHSDPGRQLPPTISESADSHPDETPTARSGAHCGSAGTGQPTTAPSRYTTP